MLESLFEITEASPKIEAGVSDPHIEVGEVARPDVESKKYPTEEDMANLEDGKPLPMLGLLGLSSKIEHTPKAREGSQARMKPWWKLLMDMERWMQS